MHLHSFCNGIIHTLAVIILCSTTCRASWSSQTWTWQDTTGFFSIGALGVYLQQARASSPSWASFRYRWSHLSHNYYTHSSRLLCRELDFKFIPVTRNNYLKPTVHRIFPRSFFCVSVCTRVIKKSPMKGEGEVINFVYSLSCCLSPFLSCRLLTWPTISSTTVYRCSLLCALPSSR